MKRQKSPSAAGAAAPRPPRPPYPQTPETAYLWLRAHGITVVSFAKLHGVGRVVITDLLRGRLAGNYGSAHKGAIALGLKPEPVAAQGGKA